MSEAVWIAIVGVLGATLGFFFKDTLPSWFQSRRSPSAKESAEVDGVKWDNFLAREKWRDEEMVKMAAKIESLTIDVADARAVIRAYGSALTKAGIEHPKLKRSQVSRAFPVPGVDDD